MMRSILRKAVAAMAVCVACIPACAQKNSTTLRTVVRGSVRDAVTHRALERVVVMVEAPESGYAGQAESDGSGKFELQGLSPAVYLVRIRFPGYEETEQRIDLTVATSEFLSFELQPKPSKQSPAMAPEGPGARLDARLASVPDKARKEFAAAREVWRKGADPQNCVEHAKKAIKLYPQFADAYVLLATAEVRANHPSEGKAALDQAIAIDPKLPEAYFTMGMLQNREQDYTGAEKSLLAGLQLEDGSAEAHYELAKTYWATGRWSEAQAGAEKAISLQPNFAPPHVLLGNALLRKGDTESALTQFRKYVELDPQGPMAGQVRALIEKLQGAKNR
jgi:Flp pilus assembly protein TadD